MPSHYLTQWWFVVNLTFKNRFQWNLNQNIGIFFQWMSEWYKKYIRNMYYECWRPENFFLIFLSLWFAFCWTLLLLDINGLTFVFKAASKEVKMTTFGAASNKNIINMTFPFQCMCTVLCKLREHWLINSLAPGKIQWNLRKIIFKLILVADGCDISSEIALRWTSLDLRDDKSTLVQVMAWCRQATSH